MISLHHLLCPFLGVLNLTSKIYSPIKIDFTIMHFLSNMFVYFFQVIFNCLWIMWSTTSSQNIPLPIFPWWSSWSKKKDLQLKIYSEEERWQKSGTENLKRCCLDFLSYQDGIGKWSKEIYQGESEQESGQVPKPTCLCQHVSVDNLTSKKYAFDKNMAFNLPSTGWLLTSIIS